MKYITRKILGFSFLCALSFNIYPLKEAKNQIKVANSSVSIKSLSYIVPSVVIGSALCAYLIYTFFQNSSSGDINSGAANFKEACQRGDLEAVQNILCDVEDIDSHLEDNLPLIHFVCKYGNRDVLKWLVEEKGLRIDKVYEEKVKKLTEDGGIFHHTNIKTPLFVACENGNDDIVEYLIEKEVAIDSWGTPNSADDSMFRCTPLYVACQKGYYNIVRLLLQAGAQCVAFDRLSPTPFHIAVIKGHSEIVRLFLDNGISANLIDNRNCTLLHRLAMEKSLSENQKEIARLLMLHHADAERSTDLPVCDDFYYGVTPLYLACWNGNVEMVDFLVEHDINVNFRCDGIAPLHKAFNCCDPDRGHIIIKKLIEHGADIDVGDEEGKTILSKGRRVFSNDMIRYLIKKGATDNATPINDIDPNDMIKNRLHYLHQLNNRKIVRDKQKNV